MKAIFEDITDMCLCGSGKKYIDCCKGKINPFENEIINKQFMSELDKLRRNSNKMCLHPKSDECSNQKAHAHTISQKAVLELIAQNGEVLMPVFYGVEHIFQMKFLGIEANASKFYCFCSNHDAMFSEIDKREVKLDKYTYFLYAYRIFASTYYKVFRELEIYDKLRAKYDYNFNPYVMLFYIQARNSMPALDWYKSKFDKAITKKKYGCLRSIHIELNYAVHFAAATCFNLMFDLFGNRITHAEYDIPMVYISIIPNVSKSTIIFSWFKDDDCIYGFFKEQIKMLPTRFILKYLNNLLPLNCENMAISPIFWNSWSNIAQQEFMSLCNSSLKNRDILKNTSSTYFKERTYNLFEK